MDQEVAKNLSAGWGAIAQQAAIDSQRLAQQTLLAFQKDLFQGGQGESPALTGALNTLAAAPVPRAQT